MEGTCVTQRPSINLLICPHTICHAVESWDLKGGLSVWFFERETLARAFELMDLYRDHPMDLADASLVAAAESLGTRKIFTVDRKDFETYRVRRGHRHYPFEVVP